MFTFVNLGIYRTSPSQFQVVGDAGFLQMMHYSLSAFALNGVEGVNPVGPWALTLKIAIGFTGVVLFATLLLNLLIAARHIRQDDALRKVADDTRRLGADLEVELRREYHVDIDEAARRLEGMGRTLVVVANEYMQRRIPAPSVSGEE
jgi:hypothetical protein